MSILANLFGSTERRNGSLENPTVALSDSPSLLSLFRSSSSFSGEAVTEETALAVPSLLAAVNVISGTIASLPLQLFKNTPEGRQKSTSDPLYRIIHDQVNADYLTSFAWRKGMIARLLLRGRAFTFIERNGAGKVTNLWPLNPDNMTVEVKGWRRIYRYRDAAGVKEFQSSEIIDLIWLPGPDGHTHQDPLYVNRNAIGLAIAAERYASSVFENGGVPPYVLETAVSSPGAAERASADTAEAIKRARSQKRGVLVLPSGSALKPIGFDPDKTQMLELRKFQVIEIARVFNIPPTFLQDLSNGTYSNVEQQDLAFVKHTLTPLLEMFEQELNAKLFSDRNRQSFVEFNLDGLLRGDLPTRMTAYRTAIHGGFITPNEIRTLENREPLEGGDDLMIQGATIPLKMAGKVTVDAPVDEPVEPDPEAK